MTAELATYERNTVAVQQDAMQTNAVHRLSEWAQAAAAAYDVAVGLVDTSFVPQQFRGKPQEATAAILSGAEVGLSPMAALKSFDIIQGVAAPRALTLRAIVQSQGHEMIQDESNATRCVMRGRRRGASEWVKVVWTIDRAKGLGLVGKDNWKKQPGAMLTARATGELARLIAADAILGIGYSIEELTDGDTGGAPEIAAPAPTVRTMQRKPKDGPVAEVAKDEPEAPVDPAEQPKRSEKQSALMFAQFGELGIKERDDYSAYIADALGYEVETSKDLTVVEAGYVIDAQATDLAARADTTPEPAGDPT